MGRGDLQVQDLRVIMMLAQARGKVTTKQISDRLELPMRTVQRILNAIEQIPLPLDRDPPGMGGGIRLIGDLALKVSLPSNLVEMAALQVARELMRTAAASTMLCEALEQFVERTTNTMSNEQRAISERFARMYRTREASPSAVSSPIATMVHSAIDQGQVLVIEYVSPKELRPKRRDIEPAGMWVTDQRTYVVGFDRQKKAMRTFAMDRIRGAALGKDKFMPRSDFDVAKYFKGSVGAFVGDGPMALELQLDAEATRRLGGKRPTSTAKLATRPDGGATLQFEAPLSDELLSWMVALGSGVAVQSPSEAVDFVRKGFALRASTQPKVKRNPAKPVAKRQKPTALPGPLMRRMLKSKGTPSDHS